MKKKLVLDPFIKNKNQAYLWIIVCPSRELSKYIEIKAQTTSFYLI